MKKIIESIKNFFKKICCKKEQTVEQKPVDQQVQ